MKVDVERVQIPLGRKIIEATVFDWHSATLGSAIIFPGYFGNTRNGPYGLFVRLARKLASIGIRTLTFDYLGSGESSPHDRSFFSDLQSSHCTINFFKPNNTFYCIGHSLSCSTVAHICSNFAKSAKGIALAPIVSIEDFSKCFFTDSELQKLYTKGSVVRRGVYISQSYLNSAEKAWRENVNKIHSIIVAENDQYAKYHNDMSKFLSPSIQIIEKADHNFSIDNSWDNVIDKVVDIIINGDHAINLKAAKKSMEVQ